MATMASIMGGATGGIMGDLTENFRRDTNEMLLIAAGAAITTAILASNFDTRRIVKPIQEMKAASRRIAGGRYDELVQAAGRDEVADLAHRSKVSRVSWMACKMA
jgi:signal transduction histidine kinase